MHTRVQPYMYCCTKFSMFMPDAARHASTKQYNVLRQSAVDSTRVYRATKFTKFPILNHGRFRFHDACGFQILCTISAQLWSLGKERLVGNYAVHSFPMVYEDTYIRGHFANQCHTAVLEYTQYSSTHSCTQMYLRENIRYFWSRV
jgi:hypothetical protein